MFCVGKKNKSCTLSEFLLLINDRFVLKDYFPCAMTEGQNSSNTRKTTMIRSLSGTIFGCHRGLLLSHKDGCVKHYRATI